MRMINLPKMTDVVLVKMGRTRAYREDRLMKKPYLFPIEALILDPIGKFTSDKLPMIIYNYFGKHHYYYGFNLNHPMINKKTLPNEEGFTYLFVKANDTEMW